MVVERRSLIVSLVYGFRFARSIQLPMSMYHPCVAYTWNPTVSRDQQMFLPSPSAWKMTKDAPNHIPENMIC